MYLIEILLPITDKEGRPFAAKTYQSLRDELTEQRRDRFHLRPPKARPKPAAARSMTTSSCSRSCGQDRPPLVEAIPGTPRKYF
jgi:hypothetical protein